MRTVVARKGINGFPYSVYTEAGGFLFNAGSIQEIHQHYKTEKRLGLIRIKKETTRY